MTNMVFIPITEREKKLPFYLEGSGMYYRQEHVLRPLGYHNFQWLQCWEGEGELKIHGKTYNIKPGQGMFLYPNDGHEYYSLKDDWMVDWVSFNGYGVEELVKNMGFKKSGVYNVSAPEILLGSIRKIYNLADSSNSLKGIDSSALVYMLLTELFKYTSIGNDASTERQYLKLQPVLQFIENNYSELITLEILADTIGVTPEHLCVLFKNIVGMRPFEYIKSIRISKSKDLLIKNKDLKINQVCKLVGFEDCSYFCSVFKSFEGITPAAFKELY